MSESAQQNSSDSNFDVVCVLLIISLAVCGAIFWVSGQ